MSKRKITLELEVSRTGDRRAVKQLETEIEQLGDSAKQTGRVIQASFGQAEKDAAASARKLSRAFAALGVPDQSRLKSQLKSLSDAYRAMARDGSVSAKELDLAKKRLVTRTKELRREYHSAFGAGVKGMDKMRTKAHGLKTAFAALGVAVAAIQVKDFMVESLGVAANFDANLKRAAAVSRATAEQERQIAEMAMALGRTTKFTSTEVLEGMVGLGMAGLDVARQIEAIPRVVALAAASQQDLGDTAKTATGVMAGFGYEVNQLGRVNNTLLRTMTMTNSEFSELASAFSYIAPLASALGVSIEETGAAIGLLHNANIRGERAATGLRGGLSRLLRPTGEMRELMGELGIKVQDASGNFVGLVSLLDQLERSGAGPVEMMRLFGEEAGPAMISLVRQGAGPLRDLADRLGAAGDAAGEMSEKMQEGLKGALDRLNSMWEAVKLGMGQGLAPIIMDLADESGDGFKAMEDAAREFGAALVEIYEAVKAIIKLFVEVNDSLRKFGAETEKVIGVNLHKAISPFHWIKNAGIIATGAEGEVKQLDKMIQELGKPKKLVKVPVSADITEAKKKVAELSGEKTESAHKITPDTTEVDQTLADLDGKQTESEHVVRVRQVVEPAAQARALGGLVEQFAFGGLAGWSRMSGALPGYGGGDRVRALLEPGEFVIRKEAVRAVGAGWLYSLQEALSRGDKPEFNLNIPRYETGGEVLSLVDGMGPPASGANFPDLGTIRLEIGGQGFDLAASSDVATELARALRDQQRRRRNKK